MRWTPLLFAAALAAGLTVAASPRDARACKNVIAASDEAAKKVAALEAKLDEGATTEAAAEALKLLGLQPLELSVSASPQTVAERLTNRAVRVYALSSVRSGGALGPWPVKTETEKTGKTGKTEKERTLNLEHAAKLLGALASPKDATPAAKGEHAEALARTKPADGKKVLESLAASDLMPSAHAWAALARLRAAGGDTKGSEAALAKCKGMAGKRAAVVCV